MSILPGVLRPLVSEERAFNCEYEGCNEHAAGKIAGTETIDQNTTLLKFIKTRNK